MPLSQFLSCDWGTSSFRLRLVYGPNQKVLAEIQEPTGVRSLYEEWLKDRSQHRGNLFEQFLKKKIEDLLKDCVTPASVPLVISGMASSTVGWIECAYGTGEFHLNGTGLKIFPVKWDAPAPVDRTYLVSGIAMDNEMMRGEECQIIGIMTLPETEPRLRWDSMLILPGTHSKHVSILANQISSITTYMTGELYDVLCKHSVLRATTDATASTLEHLQRFDEGVRHAWRAGLGASLFQARTRSVLQGHQPAENTAFLSGVLIGSELDDIRRGAGYKQPLILAAAGNLSTLYDRALGILAPSSCELIRMTGNQVDRATVAAHAVILERCV